MTDSHQNRDSRRVWVSPYHLAKLAIWFDHGQTSSSLQLGGLIVAVLQRRRAHRRLERPWRVEVLGDHVGEMYATRDEASKVAMRALARNLTKLFATVTQGAA